jgi:RNA polymerase sigma-70 factor (ECF subfamily)
MSDGVENDEELVTRALNNDQAAFARLFEKYYDVVVSVAYTILDNIDAAKDCAQEAMMEAGQNLPKLREKAKFANWIYGIARNKAMYYRQRQKLHTEALKVKTDESRRLKPVNCPSEQMSRSEKAESIRRALTEVPEIYREVLVLKYIDGRSHVDIATLLDISPAAVDKRLMRGKDMLKESLQRWKTDE